VILKADIGHFPRFPGWNCLLKVYKKSWQESTSSFDGVKPVKKAELQVQIRRVEILIGVEVFPQLIFRDVPTSLPEDRPKSTSINLAVRDNSKRLFFTLR
jgi:hypothetical protein